MEKELFPELSESRYLVSSNDNPPVIMCEKHAQMFEKIMTIANLPHTIYELEDEDSHKKCHACSLLPDIVDNMPRIILPN
jgi:hypothetical protein